MRQEKQLLLDEVKSDLVQFNSFIIMSYAKLEANTANAFRRAVKKGGGNVQVVRKRVLIKAANEAGVTLSLDALPGHIGLVFAQKDPLEMTKMVFKYSKETNEAITVVGGRIDGQMYNATDVEKLSKLPSLNEMRAEFLSVLEAPLSQTLAVMDAVMTSVIYCLDNKGREESNK